MSRQVRCYHCTQRIEVSESALSLSCPNCSKRIVIQDLIVSGIYAGSKVQTCGKVVVERKGDLSAASVQASSGIFVEGSIKANVRSLGPVIIGAKARWKGDCEAPRIEIEPGANVEGGDFRIKPVPEAPEPVAATS
jgi:cytoskeletal protein CcmA (bactofilin family)